MGGTIKYFSKNLLDHEIFSANARWARIFFFFFFFEKFVKTSASPPVYTPSIIIHANHTNKELQKIQK